MIYSEIDGDIFKEIENNKYDVIIQGCNCFSAVGGGISYPMYERFQTDKFPMELLTHPFNFSSWDKYNKLGCIDFAPKYIEKLDYFIEVCNAYIQYEGGPNGDYHALFLCLKKINFYFKGKSLITPLIAGGIAGLDREIIIRYMKYSLKDLNSVTLINYKK